MPTKRARIIRALLIREMMTRYGRRNIGFLWLVAEPLILIGGILLVWSFAKGEFTHGMPVIAFALTGYSMLTLWRHQVQRTLTCLRENAPLLFHRDIRMLDMMVGRGILEFFGTLLSFSLAYLVLLLLELVAPANDHLLLALAWLLMGLFGFGAGLTLAALSSLFEGVERLVQPLMYLSLPLSGSFTLVAWLPPKGREVMLLSPLVHATEMFRAGFMGEAHRFHFDPIFLLGSAAMALVLGLALLTQAERRFEYP